jgi:hypothetical protein
MNNAKQPMPKTANVPLPPKAGAPAGPGPEAFAPQRGHNSFLVSAMHEDVGRVMQSIIDLQTEVAMLRKANQEWERRALLAEGKVEQLKQEILDFKEDSDNDIARLKVRHGEEMGVVQRELDYFKNRDAVVQTKLSIGAQHFLDCISAIDKDRKDQENKALIGLEAEIGKVIDGALADARDARTSDNKEGT